MSYDTSGNVVWQQSPHYDVSLSVDTFDGGGNRPVASTIQILREFDGETYDQIGVPSSSNDFLSMDKNYAIFWQSFQGPDLDLILEFHDENQTLMPIIDHQKSIAGAWDMENGMMVGIATYDEEGRLKR